MHLAVAVDSDDNSLVTWIICRDVKVALSKDDVPLDLED